MTTYLNQLKFDHFVWFYWKDEVMKEVKSTQRASLELCDQATQTEAGQGKVESFLGS